MFLPAMLRAFFQTRDGRLFWRRRNVSRPDRRRHSKPSAAPTGIRFILMSVVAGNRHTMPRTSRRNFSAACWKNARSIAGRNMAAHADIVSRAITGNEILVTGEAREFYMTCKQTFQKFGRLIVMTNMNRRETKLKRGKRSSSGCRSKYAAYA